MEMTVWPWLTHPFVTEESQWDMRTVTVSLQNDFTLIVKRGDVRNDRRVTANVSMSPIWCDRDRDPEFH